MAGLVFLGERRFEGPRGVFPRLPPAASSLAPSSPSARRNIHPPTGRMIRGLLGAMSSATEGRGTDHRHLRRDGSHHDVLRGCWWRREVARQRRPAISWPRKGERRRARRRRLQLRRHFFWRQQRVRLRRRRPRRSISSRSPRTSAQIVIDSWHLSSARRVESHRRTCFAVSTTRRTRRRLD